MVIWSHSFGEISSAHYHGRKNRSLVSLTCGLDAQQLQGPDIKSWSQGWNYRRREAGPRGRSLGQWGCDLRRHFSAPFQVLPRGQLYRPACTSNHSLTALWYSLLFLLHMLSTVAPSPKQVTFPWDFHPPKL